MPLATTLRRLTQALSAAFVLLLLAGTAQAQWVNEIHYDNDGGDEGEAVEVVLPGAADPADFDLYLYNGSGGAVYDGPLNLATDFTAGATEEGFAVYSAFIEGVQNGSPDGLALTENGALVPGQFLSYEGAFAATDGPAVGETSTDIGVAEGGDTPLGQSLQLVGTGTAYADFTWSGPADASFGDVNDGQTFEPASATPVVTFTESGATVTEGNEATLTVRLDFPDDTPDGNPVTVTVAFDEAASTADEADFGGPTPTQVTFDGTTDGEEQTVSVSVIAGDGDEGDEAAVFDLAIAGGVAEVGTPSTFTLAIEDSEAPEPARVQVIHNAADPALNLVDISIVDTGAGGDGASFDDVPFRSATPFFDLDPGTYQVTVTDEENLDVVIDDTVTVASGERYQFIVSRLSTMPPNLLVSTMAREASTEPDSFQVNVVIGLFFAEYGTVGASNSEDSTLLALGNYGDIGPYRNLAPEPYLISVIEHPFVTILGVFGADFSGLDGMAGTLLVSFSELLLVLPDGSAELLPANVDIVTARELPNGSLVQIEGVVTRAMGAFTRMQDETGGITIRQTSGDFFDNVADGTISPGTQLRVTGTTSEFNQLKQINDGDLQGYEVLGTTDVPAPQPVALEELAMNGEDYESELIRVGNLFVLPDGDTEFQPATTYSLLKFDVQFPVTLRVPNADDTAIDGQPIPPTLVTYTGVLGQFDAEDPAAGYQLNPVQEDDITVQEGETVPVQFIHNAPDPAFATLDLYLDGVLAFDDFAFRTATPFGDAPAGVAFEAAIAPGDSDGPEDAFFTETYTLAPGTNYQFIAAGVGEGDFEPNPDGEDITFTLLVNDDAKLFSETDDELSDFNFVHGTPDASRIVVRTDDDMVLYDDIPYGGIADYQPIAPGTGLRVTPADRGGNENTFFPDLSDRIDEAGTILASGFLDPMAQPGDAPSFGLLVVFADGTSEFVGPFVFPDTEDGAVPTAFALDGNYPNPFAGRTTLRYDLPVDAQVSVEVFDVLGRRVVEVAPETVAAGAGRTVTLDAALPSGTYLYRLTAEMPTETRTETGRMTVVR